MVLIVFIDGIGLGPFGAANPFVNAPLEILAPLGGGPPAGGVFYNYIDASLGHPGLPQSATGQAVLFTGEDAIAEAGGHWPQAPTPRLQRFITEKSVFARVRAMGRRASLLNAFDERRAAHLSRVLTGRERPSRLHPPSATTWAALAGDAGAIKTFDDVERGTAATFDLTGEVLRAFGVPAPRVSIEDAARAVARGAKNADLAVFETFLTDKAGHARDMVWARHEIVRIDRFLAHLVQAIDSSRDLVIITSDHGNLEDLSTRGHTHARVPFLTIGRSAAELARSVRSLDDIARRIVERLAQFA